MCTGYAYHINMNVVYTGFMPPESTYCFMPTTGL